jgi:hypothetical protein
MEKMEKLKSGNFGISQAREISSKDERFLFERFEGRFYDGWGHGSTRKGAFILINNGEEPLVIRKAYKTRCNGWADEITLYPGEALTQHTLGTGECFGNYMKGARNEIMGFIEAHRA